MRVRAAGDARLIAIGRANGLALRGGAPGGERTSEREMERERERGRERGGEDLSWTVVHLIVITDCWRSTIITITALGILLYWRCCNWYGASSPVIIITVVTLRLSPMRHGTSSSHPLQGYVCLYVCISLYGWMDGCRGRAVSDHRSLQPAIGPVGRSVDRSRLVVGVSL
jgi:hypothetical protein